jgi:hypothetical protein
MSVQAYTSVPSVAQDDSFDFHLSDDSGAGVDAELVLGEFTSATEMGQLSVYVDPHPTPADPSLDRAADPGGRAAVQVSAQSRVTTKSREIRKNVLERTSDGLRTYAIRQQRFWKQCRAR